MPTKNELQKIEELNDKIKKLENQKKQLEARAKDKQRKERTRRLIQIGAIMDNMGIASVELANDLKNYFETNDKFKDWFQNFINSKKENDQ